MSGKNVRPKTMKMPKLKVLQRDCLESELILRHQLKALSETLQNQLQETQRTQMEELEKRIQLNAALSTPMRQEEAPGQTKVSSTSALNSSKGTTQIQPNSACLYSTYCNGSGQSSKLKHTRTYHCERAALAITRPSDEEESMTECLKKFSALPVPRHVTVPLFEEMMGKMEEQRKHGHEQRKNFLLSMQKPFGFEERENERRGKLIAMMNEASQEDKNHAAAVKKFHKIKQDPKVANRDGQKVHHENLSVSEGPKLRTADRTRRERIGFLDESPSFQPKIIRRVPDFSRLHRALQREAAQAKDTTKCLPFHLRTSALPERQSRSSDQKSQAPKVAHLIRSKSLGALTSLSTDTLPVYITDAARKRSQAIRKSIEVRESKESAEWLRKYRMRSEAMQRTVTLHAKLLDPHRSLKEVCNEKLQHHRAADQQRMREYGRELKGMRARVSERPYLFEQVQQKSAKANVEKTFRDTLRSAGVKEQFVEENGLLRSSPSSSSSSSSSSTQDQLSRGENADTGEKIEDVREESVDCKADGMP